jgi:hypothetical protein
MASRNTLHLSPDRPARAPGTAAGITKPSGLKLPFERDESVNMTPDELDPQMRQAAEDLAGGLQDTGKGTAMNQAYAKLKKN